MQIVTIYLSTFVDDDAGFYKLSNKKKLYVIPTKKTYSDNNYCYGFTLSTKEMLISEYEFVERFDFNDKFEKITF